MTLDDRQQQLCDDNPFDFSGLSALFVNCTLKPSPEKSHTEGLALIAIGVMEANGVAVETVRAVDLDLPPGVQPNMTEHGAPSDGWPAIYEVMAADILVLLTPIWLGEKSSVCTRVIERLHGSSAVLNDAGQYAYYGRVGGCLVTGNEDGAKHCAMSVLYSLQHLGYSIPPQADAAWLGEAGPGPSLTWPCRHPRPLAREPRGTRPSAHAAVRRRALGGRHSRLGPGRGDIARLREPAPHAPFVLPCRHDPGDHGREGIGCPLRLAVLGVVPELLGYQRSSPCQKEALS